MKRIKNRIPECFYTWDNQPKAYTVAKLIEELQRLPGTLRVGTSFSGGVKLVVFHVNDPKTRRLGFVETRI